MEYKEFIIYGSESGLQVSKILDAYSDRKIRIHVIEYSAYQQALKEIAALKEENNKLTKLFSIQLDVMKTNEELIEENQKLKAALSEAMDIMQETIKSNEHWTLFPVYTPAIVRINQILGKE